MHNSNLWGGSFEVQKDLDQEDRDERVKTIEDWDKSSLFYQEHLNNPHDLDEIQQSWLLAPQESRKNRKNKYVDLGCIVVSKKLVKWVFWSFFIAFIVIVMPIIIAKSLPKHEHGLPPRDNYTLALNKSLLFFDAQKSGKLPKHNPIPWRGSSGLKDGSKLSDVKGGLVGGYYDSGENTKFHFPMAFAMTMLSWSVIEYPHKYQAINEYNHVRELIKWGTDYLLKTFNHSASTIDHIYSQVGGGQPKSTVPSDTTCWERPEDMDYDRPVQTTRKGPDLAGEMAAALAAASIVFRDNRTYSKTLIKGAETLFKFARDAEKRSPYSSGGNAMISAYYNSTGYYDEFIWGSTWLYYATGNKTYISLATNPDLSETAKAFRMNTNTSYLSWDNKLPAAMLLLTRFRMFLNPGFPYEQTLSQYHNVVGLNMCSYLSHFQVYNRTKGGLIELNNGGPKPLQYVVNAAFLANLFADYMNVTGVPGWNCGPTFFLASELRKFATSQIDYILGKNPLKMSYVVGYGDKYPKHVHHRGASIPRNGVKYSCKGGYKWRDSKSPNPHILYGAMVGGPGKSDKFLDDRKNSRYTEPTLAGNAGLVAALISLTSTAGPAVDRNLMFSGVPPLYPPSPPPPAPWKP
ncbi:endoglucanase 12-like [Silene latifolia]|uniref:endoglucanase 12-like n=1 Tax=Silene latifolia TaxID=37657 RepID=UPI003D780D78